MRIAVIGMGVVGTAQAELFAEHGVVTYDPAYDEEYPLAAIAACHFAVVAVGTPQGRVGKADLSAVWNAVSGLPAGLPVLLRSTVPPGTTDALRAARLSPVCHCPEFLQERVGGDWGRSADVPFVILGGTPEDRKVFLPVLDMLYHTYHECSALTAELAKYTANMHWAARVTFVNEMAAVTAAAGGDWAEVREAWLCDERVDPAYTAMDGFPPGFGGACWPKDLAALIYAAEEAGYCPEFLYAVQAENERFRHEGPAGSGPQPGPAGERRAAGAGHGVDLPG